MKERKAKKPAKNLHCPHCNNYRTDRRSNLDRHVRVKHNNTSEDRLNTRLEAIERQLARLVPIPTAGEHNQPPAAHFNQPAPLVRQDAIVGQNMPYGVPDANHGNYAFPTVKVADDNIDEEEEDDSVEVEHWNRLVQVWKRFFTPWVESHEFARIANCRIFDLKPSTIWSTFQAVHAEQEHAYKAQIEFGYVLRDLVDGSLEYYFASTNTSLFPKAIPVVDAKTLNRVKTKIYSSEIESKCMQKRRNSRLTFFAPVNMIVYMYGLGGPIRGTDNVMDYCKKSPLIITFASGTSNLCFFYCLAIFRRLSESAPYRKNRNVEKEAKKLRDQFWMKTGENPVDGVDLSRISRCEIVFGTGVHVLGMRYKGAGRKPDFYTIRAADSAYSIKMYLLLHDFHFMLIKDARQLCGLFECASCYHVTSRIDNFRRHESVCNDERPVVYRTGPYSPRQSIVQKLLNVGVEVVNVEDFKCNLMIAYDFEVQLKQLDHFAQNTENLEFTHQHIPLSVAVASNVAGYEEPTFFYNFTDCTKLIEDFIQYLLSISYRAQAEIGSRLEYIFDQLDQMQLETDALQNKPLMQQLRNVRAQMDNFVKRTPVVGFNSARYDLRAVKHAFFPTLRRLDGIKACIKKNGAYLSVVSDNLKFIDCAKFLGPGDGSLATYLKSYGKGTAGAKMRFPYRLLEHPERLVQVSLMPPYSDFYSELAGANVFETGLSGTDRQKKERGMLDYRKLKGEWKTGKWPNMFEYLKDYNCNDVGPLVSAIVNHQQFYFDRDILMLREFITLPSLCLPYLFTFAPPEDTFTLLDEATNKLFRSCLFGGLSLITTRYAEVGKSTIKEHIYGKDGHECAQIKCWDANLLYTGNLGQDMFTGPYVVREKENDFRPSIANRGTFTIQYLEYLALKSQEHIRHALSPDGEFTAYFEGHIYHADGFVEASDRRPVPLWLEINTCATHGCPKCFPEQQKLSSMTSRSYKEMYDESCRRVIRIRKKYQVVEYWECEVKRHYAQNAEFNYYCRHLSLAGPRVSNTKMTENDILDGIASGDLFGAVLCSVAVPNHLKPLYDQFPPIICRKKVSARTSGATMATIAETMGMQDVVREQLVSSFSAEGILFSTSTIDWYIAHGFRVYNIEKMIQFTRKQPFKSFTKTIAKMRLQADIDEDPLHSTTAKALGNSSYGFTLYTATSATETKFADRNEALNHIRSNQFISLEELGGDTVEISVEKRKIVEGLPLHIGFQVYALSKIYMQHFVHDILGKHLDAKKWEVLASDTDSICLALAHRSIDDCVMQKMRASWNKKKPSYFVDTSSAASTARTSRTPLLFKEEIESADVFLAPTSKCYYAGKHGDPDDVQNTVKTSAKGVNKRQNRLTETMYREAVFGRETESGRVFGDNKITNIGFRSMGPSIYTYEQAKRGLSPIYLKREVLPNLYSTRTLEDFA